MSNKPITDWEVNFIWAVDFPHGEYFSDQKYRRKIVEKLLHHHEMTVDDYAKAYPDAYNEYCKKNPQTEVKLTNQ
jgi:hypothetical protein